MRDKKRKNIKIGFVIQKKKLKEKGEAKNNTNCLLVKVLKRLDVIKIFSTIKVIHTAVGGGSGKLLFCILYSRFVNTTTSTTHQDFLIPFVYAARWGRSSCYKQAMARNLGSPKWETTVLIWSQTVCVCVRDRLQAFQPASHMSMPSDLPSFLRMYVLPSCCYVFK